MFKSTDVYESNQRVQWNMSSPEHAIQRYYTSVAEFIQRLAVPGLETKPLEINIGGMLFGRAVVQAIRTALKDSGMYAVSLGLTYGPRSVLLVTLRCMEGGFLKGPAGVAGYELARLSSRATVKKMLDFDFMDATMRQLHESAVEKVVGQVS